MNKSKLQIRLANEANQAESLSLLGLIDLRPLVAENRQRIKFIELARWARVDAKKADKIRHKASSRARSVRLWRIHEEISNNIADKRKALVHAIEWQESHFIGKKLKP